MWIESNSSFENKANSQVNKKSEIDLSSDIDKNDKSKNVTKINDILVLLEWKIDENQENELRQLLNNQDFASLESFLKDQNNLSQLKKINNPDEIIVFFNSKFDNKTKGGGVAVRNLEILK